MIFKDMNVFGSSLYCYFKIPYFLLNQVVESGLFSLNIMSFNANNYVRSWGQTVTPPKIHKDHRITVQAGEWVCTSVFVTIEKNISCYLLQDFHSMWPTFLMLKFFKNYSVLFIHWTFYVFFVRHNALVSINHAVLLGVSE